MRDRLAWINGRSPVEIEIADGEIPAVGPEEIDPDAWPHPGIRAEFLEEEHHRQYGRPWAVGKYIFEFVAESGVRPDDLLLDFGCGALRFGIWAIDYLSPGRYHGVDSHLASLEAGATYEIPLHGLEEKRPRLLWNDTFRLSHFQVQFDVIVDFHTTGRIHAEERLQAFASLAEVLAPGGRLLTSPKPGISREALEGLGLRQVRKTKQEYPLLAGHRGPRARWFELAKD